MVLLVLAVDHFLPEAPPRLLHDWVARLASDDYAERDAAVAELVRRSEEDPERVISALVDSMRGRARELGKGLRGGDRRFALRLVVEPPGYGGDGEPESLWVGDRASWDAFVEQELDRREAARVAGRPYVPSDPRYAVVSPARVRGPNPAQLFLLAVPGLPIGAWVFGARTIHDEGAWVDLEVTKEVRETWRAFERRHGGRRLAFVADGEVVAVHPIGEPSGGRLRLSPMTPDEEGRRDLARASGHPGRSFHDGQTEAARVLVRLGGRAKPALEALAGEGEAQARVAAWAWWGIEANEAEAAGTR